ncbi:hypothetical protein [Roseiarcus sp.]
MGIERLTERLLADQRAVGQFLSCRAGAWQNLALKEAAVVV